MLHTKFWFGLVGMLVVGLALVAGSRPAAQASAEAAGVAPANSPASIVLPSPVAGATSDPSIAIDASGRVHVAFEIALGGEVIYATCAANCGSAASWTSVQVGTNGSLGSRPILELTPGGQPRIMYLRDDGSFSAPKPLIYNGCDSNCTSTASWTEREIVTNVAISDFPFFALDPQGRPRAVVRSGASFAYLTCESNCAASASNWLITPLTAFNGSDQALTIDSAGNPHLLYQRQGSGNDVLIYASCSQDCTAEANWGGGEIVDIGFDFRGTHTIDTDSANRPRIAFFTANLVTNDPTTANALVYAWCDSACEDGNNWGGVLVGTAQNEGVAPDIILDANDRPHISYYNDAADFELGYATCSANCESNSGSWTIDRVESPLNYPSQLGPGCLLSNWYMTGPISLALDPAGNPQIAFVARNMQFCNNVDRERLRLVRFLDLGQPTTTPTPTTSPGTPTPPPSGTPGPTLPPLGTDRVYLPLMRR